MTGYVTHIRCGHGGISFGRHQVIDGCRLRLVRDARGVHHCAHHGPRVIDVKSTVR